MPTLAIQPGTTIFVTGANGLIGSHVIEQLLKMGYNVRGAVRSVGKCQWLADYFRNTNESVKLELVEVPDMTVDGCYDEAVQGTAGIVHIASPLNGEDPNVAIPIAVNVGLNALKAAAKTPSITRVVYTSSSLAATYPSNGVKKVLDQHSYNEEGIRKGWKHPEDEPESHKSLNIYAALKAEAEKACWKWVEENRPDFVFNSILPNVNFSKVLVPEHQGTPSTIAWGKAAFTVENFAHYAKVITPQYYISTQDCALLHISALLYKDVSHERLFGFAQRWNFNDLLAIYRVQYPDRTFAADMEGLVDDGVVAPTERAEEVLGWVKEGKGWDPLDKAVKEMCVQFA